MRRMPAQIIDGKSIASEVKTEVRRGVDALIARGGRRPALAVVMVGDNPASHVYVRNKRRACEECGITSIALDLPQSTSEVELLARVDDLNLDGAVLPDLRNHARLACACACDAQPYVTRPAFAVQRISRLGESRGVQRDL